MSSTAGILSKWYVIQVRTSAEEVMCRKIEKACAEHDEAADSEEDRIELRECFNPRFRTQRKWKGEWQDVEHSLMPGYVLADVSNPDQLASALHKIGDFCKLLSDGETYTPLSDSERTWMEYRTSRGDRVIPMSIGHKVGEHIEIVDGPLAGYVGEIDKIDRANSLAHLVFHVGQMRLKTTVGLAVISKSVD